MRGVRSHLRGLTPKPRVLTLSLICQDLNPLNALAQIGLADPWPSV